MSGEVVLIVEEIHSDWQLLRFCARKFAKITRSYYSITLSEYFSSYYKLIACIFRIMMTIIRGIMKNLIPGGQFINYLTTKQFLK